ncbi:MAG: beta-ketoacyl-[acyl-carrier-protein] synthase family protein, partial [Spirochaetes bacterium]|nr:beta-ketoacyl-[acyl-carrier-protein] synthase family protein [Spirochaetota bacterium]
GFNEIYALSTLNDSPQTASQPFSADRDGFVAGEGAGMILLESEASIKKRKARVIAEIAGYGLTSEAYNIMAPIKDGAGMVQTMEKALTDADLAPEKINYINAHGTATTLNDLYETQAIKTVFGSHAYQIPISSTKSMIGHTIGAAGVIELGVTAMSVDQDLLTPTINLTQQDPELDLDYVANQARNKEINYALSNSFAFGGHNASIILKKYQEI